LQDVFGADVTRIGTATLVMGFAMVAGNLIYGPMDRVFGTRKWVVVVGNTLGMLCLGALWLAPAGSEWGAVALLAAIGFFGASFAVIMAHGRSFIPAHLVGRGISLMNLFGIGGAGIMQFSSGPIFLALSDDNDPAQAYGQLFGLFGIAIALGLVIYLFSRDSTN
jgi:nitrate/nitrite transporter NarK